MKRIHVAKGRVLQHAGDTHTKVYFVERGMLRSYVIDKKGKEHVFMFGPEGWSIADSQGPEVPSELYIDALEDSVLLVSEKDVEAHKPDAQALIRRIAVLQKRVIMLMSARAIERYDHFLETYPNIIQRVPQKMIASYLGITPEALSK